MDGEEIPTEHEEAEKSVEETTRNVDENKIEEVLEYGDVMETRNNESTEEQGTLKEFGTIDMTENYPPERNTDIGQTETTENNDMAEIHGSTDGTTGETEGGKFISQPDQDNSTTEETTEDGRIVGQMEQTTEANEMTTDEFGGNITSEESSHQRDEVKTAGSRPILKSGKKETPSHVSFSEKETPAKIAENPSTNDIPEPPPLPPTAEPMPSKQEEEEEVEDNDDPSDFSTHVLSCRYVYGYTRESGIQNLTTQKSTKIFFTTGHLGVIHDYTTNIQMLLKAHHSNITCHSVSDTRRWLVTCDCSPEDSRMIVWDTTTAQPIRTILDVAPAPMGGESRGIISVVMSPDAKLIVTLSDTEPQTLTVWDWLNEDFEECVVAAAYLDVSQFGFQKKLVMGKVDTNQLVSHSDTHTLFYKWQRGSSLTVEKAVPLDSTETDEVRIERGMGTGMVEYFAPTLNDKTFKRSVGKITCSEFHPQVASRAISGTSLGNVVVWDINANAKQLSSIANKTPVKLIKMSEKAITCAATLNGYIVIGDAVGDIKFLDSDLQMINWYQDMHFGPIFSFHFDHHPNFNFALKPNPALEGLPDTATIEIKKFKVPNAIFTSTSSNIVRFVNDGQTFTCLKSEHESSIRAIAASPVRPHIVLSSYHGFCQLINYEKNITIASRLLYNASKSKLAFVRCCSFDPSGAILAMGTVTGVVRLVDALTLEDWDPSNDDEPQEIGADGELSVSTNTHAAGHIFRVTSEPIMHLAFSHDSHFLATGDYGNATTLFEHKIDPIKGIDTWRFIGRYRAHYKPIQDLMFGVSLDNQAPRLLTLGVDRNLVEYQLPQANQVLSISENALGVYTCNKVDQSATPMCMTWYPSIGEENFILVANNQYKCKLYNTTTKACRYTYLGPTFGSPLQKLCALPTLEPSANSKRYVAWITTTKLGLSALPIDGNPHKNSVTLAHAGEVADMCCSFDGKYIFTAGGPDCSVSKWRVNLTPLEAQVVLSKDGTLEPFYGLLDGGKEGKFFKDMTDFFYYAQIKKEGVDTMAERKVMDYISLTEVPDMMRALGFYPSEQEIEDMTNEIKFSQYITTGEFVDKVNLDTFIRLYVNHRPTFGLEVDRIKWAFNTITDYVETTGETDDDAAEARTPLGSIETIRRDRLIEFLQLKGEHIQETALAEILISLLGFDLEDECGRPPNIPSAEMSKIIEDKIPEQIVIDKFIETVLGFQEHAKVATNLNDSMASPKKGGAGDGAARKKQEMDNEMTLISEITGASLGMATQTM